MDYEISTKDDIPDKSPGEWESMDDKKLGHISWMTHGNTDKWLLERRGRPVDSSFREMLKRRKKPKKKRQRSWRKNRRKGIPMMNLDHRVLEIATTSDVTLLLGTESSCRICRGVARADLCETSFVLVITFERAQS